MAIIKKYSSFQNLSGYGVLINDTNPNSTYFRITELGENFTGGKNGFLIEGSECLKETTEIKVEILDVNGNPIYFEPGKGAPGYYEGLSKVVGVYIYEDTPIGLGKITVLGELKSYFDANDNKVDIPDDWKGVYNVKWEKQINVNRNLANESRVRFYKRPKITIEELSKPLFTKTIPTITQSGSLDGIPQVPVEGQDYREYAGGVLYKLKVNSGPNFTSSIDENVISFPTLNYFPTVKEVLSETEVLVDSPYTSSDGLVQPFSATEYTSSFENNAGAIITESALTGSFAKIKITNLKTFVGDVARVKVFRKSRNETGDFQFVQEQLLESTELLKDITTTADTELSYGVFDDYNLTNYWISGSTTHPITLNNTELLNGVKIDYAGTGTQLLYTSESIAVGDNIEYNLSFKTKLSGSVDETKQINAYLSSSEFTQSVVVVSGSADTLQKFDVSKNIISTNSGSARLVFEVNGDDWYISNVSFKNAQESSFSPDEFTLVQEVPRKLDSEFFDFKFEFYDINNNFIPVKVKGSKEFSGGNLTSLSNVRLLEFETDRTAFRFSSGSLGNPPFQQSRFRVTSNGLTGSITFESAAFDKDGVYIDPSSYSGAYPGGLTSNNVLTIASFSGSDTSVTVGSITYTASIEDKEEFETITRFEDGEPASALIVTTNQNQFFYKATDLSVEPSGQVITIQAQRKNLASDTTTITANSGSGKPGLTVGSTTNGITTFTLNASDYPFGTGNTTYEFSGSDEFGSVFVDRITVSPVKKLDGVGLNLSNTNATFTADEGGSITGDLHSSSGSVDFRIGSEAITFENSLSTNNRFNIAGVTGSGVTPTNTNPTKNEYSISGFAQNSGSLTININYKDGSGDVSEFQQIVNYTKALQGASGSDGVNGSSGTDAKAVSLSSTKYAIVYDGDGNLFPASQPFTLSGSAQGFTTPEYQFLQDGTQIQAFSTDTDVIIPTDAGALPTAGDSKLYEVRVREQGESYDGVFDNIDVFGVQSGSDAFTVFLTNEAHVYSATSESVVTSVLSDGAFEVRFFRGALQYNFGSSGKTYSVSATSSSIELAQSTVSNQRKFTPTSITDDSGSATITVTDNNTSVSFTKQYSFTLSKEGNEGAQGPAGADGASAGAVGIVYRGEYSSGDTYVSQSNPGRLDVVKYSDAQAGDNYWIANNSGSLGQPSPSSSDWQAFGEEFSSVATDILFAQDVYADRTINVGSSGSNPVISLNSDHANSNANPYIGMNISSYAANEGVYFGYDGGTPKLSLKGGASDGFLTWDGSNLNIQGAITITGGATADSLSALNSTTASLNTSVTNINTSTASLNTSVTNINSTTSSLNTSVTNINTTTSSLNTSVTNINSTTESLQGEVDGISAITTSLENPSEYSFGPDALFDLAEASAPSTTGLYLGATNMGYYNNGWKTYMDDTGQFYLTGSGNNYLIWDGSTLDIAGAITIRPGGNAATSTDVSTAATNAVTSGSNAASTAQTNAQNFATTAASSSAANASGSAISTSRGELNASSSVLAGDITTAQTTANAANASASTDPTTGKLVKAVTPAGEGLFMGSSELGYFSGSNWQTYMSSSGDFFLEGDGGSLTWDYISSSLTIQGRISGSSIQGGTIQGSSIAGGEINVPNADAPLFHVDGAGNMSAQNVSISGSVNLDAGQIGGWIVDDEAAGGSLRDENSRIVFNPDLPEFQLYDSSANRKVAINPNDSLSSPGSSDIYASSLGSSVNGSSTSATTTDSYSSVSSAFVQGSASNTFNITTAGSWEVQDINITSTFTQTTTSIPSVTATVSSPAYNYYPSYPYAQHSGQASGGTSYVYLYLSLYSTADELIHREQIAYSFARGAYNSGASYTSVAASYSPTGFAWQYSSGGSTISATSYASSTYNDEFLVSIANTGNHYLVYEQKVVNRSAYKTDVDNYGNTTTTFSTFTKSGLNITSLDTAVTLAAPSNFVEINAGGFQAVSDSSQYVRIRRTTSGQTNPTLMNVVGGNMYLGEYGDEIDDLRIYNYGKSQLTGETILGGSWQNGANAGDKPRGVRFEGNVNWKHAASGISGTGTSGITNTTTSSNLGYQIATQGNFVVLDPSGTKYFTLPCRYNGTYYADGDKFEDGDMIVLWNRRDNNSNCRVYGIVDGGLHNHSTIAGGKALLLIYWDSFGCSRGWNSSIQQGWIVVGSYDNTD